MIVRLASVDPSSTRISSFSGHVCESPLSIACATQRSALKQGIRMDTTGAISLEFGWIRAAEHAAKPRAHQSVQSSERQSGWNKKAIRKERPQHMQPRTLSRLNECPAGCEEQ